MDILKQNASNVTADETHGMKMRNDVFSCYHFTVTDFNIGEIWPGWYILGCALSAVFSIAATVTNLLVLVAIRRTPSLHSPSNTLLFGLALADLGVGLFVHPLYFSLITGKLRQNKNVFCEAGIAVEVIANALCIISLLTVTAVSLDRYLALRLHLRYKELVTIKRAIISIGIIWLIGAFSGTLWLYAPEMVKYNVMIIIVLCLLAAAFSYVQIYRAVSRVIHSELTLKCAVERNENIREQEANMANFKSHALSTFLVYCLIIICYLPYFCVVFVITLTGHSISKRFSYDITAILVFINSSLNPLVYCWRLRDIRNAVRKTAKLLVPSHAEKEQSTCAQNWRSMVIILILMLWNSWGKANFRVS